MNLKPGNILEIILHEMVWNLAAFTVTAVIGIIIMRLVFQLSLKQVIHEVEEVQNAAVGASFFIIALIASLWMGKMGGDFTSRSTPLQQVGWSAIGFIVATIVFVSAYFLVYRLFCHRPGESPLAYLRREARDEKNAAMILFVGSLAVVPFVLAIMITV